jgi:hypothetical protein
MIPEYFTNKVIFLSSVGINTGLPNVELTVSGVISSNNIIYDLDSNSLEWKSGFTTINNLSSKWESVYTSVKDTSANWDSVYTTYNENSATYATITYVDNKFLPLSGGTITGDLSVLSSLDIGLSLEVGVGDTVLFVSGDKVGVNTETPNLELTVNGSISSNNEIYISNYKTVKTPITNNPGVSAVSTILVVSALPVSPISSILYIVV